MNPKIVPKVVRLLQGAESPSRNQAWGLYDSGEEWQTMRYYKLVKSLENEIVGDPKQVRRVKAVRRENQVEVRVENPLLRYTRQCLLPVELFDCLAQRLSAQGLNLEIAPQPAP